MTPMMTFSSFLRIQLWLLQQAAANVALAKRFKYEKRCAKYVDMVEERGVALCHFHGYVDRAALPPNMVSIPFSIIPFLVVGNPPCQ